MDALSDYICKSNELVDKMLRILIYIERTAIRKGSKDQDRDQRRGTAKAKTGWKNEGISVDRTSFALKSVWNGLVKRPESWRTVNGKGRGRWREKTEGEEPSFRERAKLGMENETNRRRECVTVLSFSLLLPLTFPSPLTIRGKERKVARAK